MPWSAGTFSRTNGVNTGSALWAADRDAGTKIRADRHDTHDQDLGDGINTCLTKDGQNSPSANLPMATFNHTNVGTAAARTEYARADQVQDSTLNFVTDGGSANTYTANLSPAISSYAQGSVYRVKITNTNTDASTLNLNSIGAKDIIRMDGSAVEPGNLVAGRVYVFIYESTLDDFLVANPSFEINPLSRGYIDGFVISNGTDTDHDIDIAAGVARDTANTANIEDSTGQTKQIDASWATGTNAGGLSSSLTLSASTTYHVIAGKVSGTVEYGFDTSPTGANLVTDHSFTNTRRIGSVVTDSSSNIRQFFYRGSDRFDWVDRVSNIQATSTGVSAVTRTLTVPTGIEVIGLLIFTHQDDSASTTNYTLVSALDETDATPGATNHTTQIVANGGVGQGNSNNVSVKTSTSGQIRTRNTLSAADIAIRGMTYGWIDSRGRDA